MLVRLLNPTVYGIWSSRLYIVFDSIETICKGCSIKAAPKSKDPNKFSMISFLFFFIVAPIVGYLTLRSPLDIPGYREAILMTIFSAFLCILGDFWSTAQLARMQGAATAKVTGISYLLRSIYLVFMTKQFYKSENDIFKLMMIFGTAYLFGSIVYILGFFFYCGKPHPEFPRKEDFKAVSPFIFQSLIQWAFAQGERIVLMRSISPEQLGIYSFVADLGSIVARLLFNPIESTVYNMCASSESVDMTIFCLFVRGVLYIGLAAMSFGPHVAPPVIKAVYSARWSGDQTSQTLSMYLRVLPIMALNGLVEAFANARLSGRSVTIYSTILMAVMALYIILVHILSEQMGAVGAILANGINMLIRALMGISVITYKEGFQHSLFPNPLIIAAFVAVAFYGGALKFTVLIGVGLLFAGLIVAVELPVIKRLYMEQKDRKE